MNERSSDYLHGTAPEEQRRLTVMNHVLNESSFAQLDLRGDERILDVGCGLAQLTRMMARKVAPEGKVIGIERSEDQILEAMKQARDDGEEDLIEIRRGDALVLPLRPEEKNSFDLVHGRFILEHVPDPLRAVKQMMRAVAPGGRIVLEDDDHDVLRLYPEPAFFNVMWRAYVRSYERNGNDPYVGRHLVSLLAKAGATPRKTRWISWSACAGDPLLVALVENLVGVLHTARGAMFATGELDSPSAFQAGIDAIIEWSTRNDAAFWFARCWAEATAE